MTTTGVTNATLVSRESALVSPALDQATPLLEPQQAETKPLVEVDCSADGEISVRGQATIHHVAQLHSELKRITTAARDRWSINLADLTALDTAGAQTLLAFKRRCPNATVHSCPPSIRQFLELTGLTCLLTSEVE